MGLLGPLRETLSAYRRRKQHSIDGAVAGVGYNQYQRGYNRTAFDRSLAVGPARTAQMYDPDPGSAEFPEPEYQPYEWEMSPHPTPLFRTPPPQRLEPEGLLDHDAGPMTDELFVRAMREASGRPETQEPVPFDHGARDQGISHGPGSLDELVADRAPYDPIQEIETAISEQRPPDLGHYVLHDGYLHEYQAAMNQAMDSMWNAQPPATQPDPIREEVTTLDDQIQNMPAQSPMPEPQPVEEDPWEMQRRMYDEQMQAMMSPFMMGPRPMM